MALAISSASPMALSLVVFTSKTSSNALDTQRKAIDAPTLPLPIIESIIYIKMERDFNPSFYVYWLSDVYHHAYLIRLLIFYTMHQQF